MAYIIKNDLIFNNLVMYTNVLLRIISKWHGKSFLFDLRNTTANFQAGLYDAKAGQTKFQWTC